MTSERLRPGLSIYLVTDPHQCADRGVVTTVAEAVAGGVSCVQVRDKEASAAALLTLLLEVGEAVGEHATVLVDDRVDVFLAARQRGAAVHGIHVGQDDLPVADVRRLVGPDAIVGLTAHTQAHLDAVDELPTGTADYLGVGAVMATATKPDHPAPLGVDGVGAISSRTELPCVAIGGITAEHVAPLRRAGVAGVAVVSAICGDHDPRAAATTLRREWER